MKRAQAFRRIGVVRRSPVIGPALHSGPPLQCPNCGEENLHHGRVTIYDRGEDDEWTTKTTVDNGVTVRRVRSLGSGGKGNPSSRRHGLIIRFSCEHCDARPELRLSQHKGNSFLELIEPVL